MNDVNLWLNSAPLEVRFIFGYILAFFAGMQITYLAMRLSHKHDERRVIEPMDYNIVRSKKDKSASSAIPRAVNPPSRERSSPKSTPKPSRPQ